LFEKIGVLGVWFFCIYDFSADTRWNKRNGSTINLKEASDT